MTQPGIEPSSPGISANNNISIMVSVSLYIQVQIPDEAVCISHRANTIRKGMYQTILPSAMGK